MPFKSEAQRRKFGELLSEGKISQATFDEWNSTTPSVLPERIEKPQASPLAQMVRKARRAQVIR